MVLGAPAALLRTAAMASKTKEGYLVRIPLTLGLYVPVVTAIAAAPAVAAPPGAPLPPESAHAQRVIRVLALTPPTSGRGQMKKSPGMLKMWQRRWFVLDGGVVTYYKNHAEVSAPLCPSSRRGLAALSQRPAACRPVCRWGSAS